MVMWFNWMMTNMCYYGLTSVASVLLEDIYINYTLVILGKYMYMQGQIEDRSRIEN